jgi:hypothetical protein
MFTVTMLPAQVGDCLWIEYGDPAKPHRILIDCGTRPTAVHLRKRIQALGAKADVELLIVTHVDTDHIGGVLPLFDEPPTNLRIGEVWYNAWPQIQPGALDLLGPLDGEVFSQQLVSERHPFPWRRGFRWNTRFGRKGRSPAAVRAKGDLPGVRLAGGMRLTLLSPGKPQLDKLRGVWEKACKEAGLVPGVRSSRLEEIAAKKGADFLGARDPVRELAETDSDPDTTEANGSTIAVLAEYDDGNVTKRLVLAGDAHSDVLTPSLQRLARERGQERLKIDAFKLPHHGSEHNVTRELIETVDCRHFLFSSNSTVFKSPHPHAAAVARAVHFSDPGTTLHFNYRTKVNEQWDQASWIRRYRYDVDYGDGRGTCSVGV